MLTIDNILKKQLLFEKENISLIASENYVCNEIKAILGSNLTNKYAEGYSNNRYYSGCKHIDEIESLTIEHAKKLFNVKFANVQPYSGSIANLAVYLSILEFGDTILSMSLDSGGHLTHGLKFNFSGKNYNFIHYSVDPKTYLIDYDQIDYLAKIHKPKLIIAGCSSYPRSIDFKSISQIAKKYNCLFLADIAHIAGIIAAKKHINPNIYADIITTTTHKTLRGPRGGMILTNNELLAKKINKSIFPGLQGGPLMNIIAAKGKCFEKAMSSEFQEYIQNVLYNTQTLNAELCALGCSTITSGSDNHMLLINTIKNFNLNGLEAQNKLEEVGLLCNKNIIPFDNLPPAVTSGIRLGLSAITTRKIYNIKKLAQIIVDTLHQTINANDLKQQVKNLISSSLDNQ